MKKKINFENAQQLRRQYPDTFYAPGEEELQKLQQGDMVKICALQERFWAEVISITDKIVTARVDNDLLMRQLKYNDIIDFHLDNVYDIMPKTMLSRSVALVSSIKKKGQRPKGPKL